LRFEEIARAAAPWGKPCDVAVLGHRAYLANGPGGLIVVDIRRDVAGGYAYLTEYYSGLHVVRLVPGSTVSRPQRP